MPESVKKGLLGEVLHAEAGYCHDLRAIKFREQERGPVALAHSIRRTPICIPRMDWDRSRSGLDINRGDRYDYLVSVSSPARGWRSTPQKTLGPTDQRAADGCGRCSRV